MPQVARDILGMNDGPFFLGGGEMRGMGLLRASFLKKNPAVYPHALAMVMDEFLQWMILDAIGPCHIDIIPPKDLLVLFFSWYIRGFTAVLRVPLNP